MVKKLDLRRRPFYVFSLAALLTAFGLAVHGGGPPPEPALHSGSPAETGPQEGAAVPDTPETPTWDDVDRLVEDQKLEAASRLAGELRTAAQAAGDAESWTRGLIREVQLRTALHGYETSVRFLRQEPWPEDTVSRTVLELFYAHSLTTYLQAYSWEIQQRETVVSSEEVDLKAWTREQIYQEAVAAFGRLWPQRREWGDRPLGTLAEYVNQNNYPPRIRGTLRDAVTYLWAELLADSSGWSAEQNTGTYRLDLAELLGDPELGQEELVDPEVHPLRRIAGLLADLEAWHREGARPEAAFEARLERLRRLQASFTREEEKERLRQDLAEHREELGRRYPWWSMGMALEAEWVRGTDDPDALVEARQLALEGQKAHPSSVGGQRCASIVGSIEAPAYRLTAMTTDGLGRRSVSIDHKNLGRLHFRAYAVDVDRLLGRSQDYNLLPMHREVEEILAKAEPVAGWSTELPPTPDYREHRTYVTPPGPGAEGGLPGKGLYLVVASARRDFADGGNQRTAVNFLVTGLVMVTRQDGPDAEVTVLDGATGEPRPGASVELYRFDWQKGHKKVRTRQADAEGRASFALDGNRNLYFFLARQGEDLVVDPERLRGHYDDGSSRQTSSLVYTDRSVYRPRQTLHWKVVTYEGERQEGRFRTRPGADLKVELVDPNGEVVAEAEATANDFGTASGSFEIPSGRLLGGWYLRTGDGGGSSVLVEEYKRPTFEVEIREAGESLRLNRPAELVGEAKYYFGLPVVAGEVDWRVVRQPVYPAFRSWWWPQPNRAEEIIAGGRTALGEDGTFTVSFLPEADERLADSGISYYYRLSVDVTDEGGETRSASRSFRLGFVTVETTLGKEVSFFTADQEAVFDAQRRDLDGTARPGTGRWRLLRLEQPEEAKLPAEQPLPRPPATEGEGEEPYRTEGDLLRPRWEGSLDPDEILGLWPDGEEIAAGTVEHGEGGKGEVPLGELAPGAYRLRYETEDEHGATFETERSFIVAADGRTPLALPGVFLVQKPTVAVGETALVLVHSGLEDQMMEVETLRGETRLDRRRLGSGEGLHLLEIPVDASHRGGFRLRHSLLRDYQLLERSERIIVPWDDRLLQVETATFRDLLRPGQRETWTVTLKSDDEEVLAAGAAEVLAYMYDRSLDVFAPHSPANPMDLYPSFLYGPGLSSSLGSQGEVWRRSRSWYSVPSYPHLHGDHLAFFSGYGIGGPGHRGLVRMRGGPPAPMAMAAAPEAEAREADAGQAVAEFSASVSTQKAASSDQLGDAGREEAGIEMPPPAEGEATLRENFSETAFWHPHLLTGDDGSVTFEFEVPDSVTEWNFWVLGVTRDLRSGSAQRQVKTVKELLVRPYLPRFLREGDRAELKVVVNNAGEEDLDGTLTFAIEDPATGESLLDAFGLSEEQARASFEAAAGGSATLTFPVAAPPRVGTVAFRVEGEASGFKDGELRPLPVLPGRFHLIQSRFAALREGEREELTFAELAADDDPTRIDQQLVVTLDGQLFYSVLSALPYLVDYPYECTEQTLNRFLSTGIMESVFDEYPAVAQMAKTFAERETPLEAWDDDDPNRRMALEETPWLRQARGGDAGDLDLVKVLDPKVAKAQRKASLADLEKAQTSLGGFPWWPGGPPSPFMTLYLLQGFSRALEFDVEVPQPMVQRAWAYMHRHYLDEMVRHMVDDGCCWETVTFLNFVLSSYGEGEEASRWTGGVFTEDDRKRMLDFSFRHWRDHSPRLKAALAMTLHRAGRGEDATLVFDSVMDSAKTTEDEGTFWQPEDRAWLWYNDTIEGHALALRTLTELDPDDPRRHGLVQWLMLNKKLNHWKSTRATAEVIYAMVHYLEQEDALAVEEKATVTVGPRRQVFEFDPAVYTGRKNQVVIDGPEVEPSMATTVVEKEGKGLLFASATWHFSTEELPEEAQGDFLNVERTYFRRVRGDSGWNLEPLAEGAKVEVGDQVEVQISLRSRQALEYVHLRDPRAAGLEPESTTSGYRWDLGIGWYEEVRDSGANFFFDWLPAGEYTFKVRLRAATAGTFKVAPATIQPMYAPEFAAYSSGTELAVAP